MKANLGLVSNRLAHLQTNILRLDGGGPKAGWEGKLLG
jgi:hypothetical protein